jgi:hypothetical protein
MTMLHIMGIIFEETTNRAIMSKSLYASPAFVKSVRAIRYIP